MSNFGQVQQSFRNSDMSLFVGDKAPDKYLNDYFTKPEEKQEMKEMEGGGSSVMAMVFDKLHGDSLGSQRLHRERMSNKHLILERKNTYKELDAPLPKNDEAKGEGVGYGLLPGDMLKLKLLAMNKGRKQSNMESVANMAGGGENENEKGEKALFIEPKPKKKKVKKAKKVKKYEDGEMTGGSIGNLECFLQNSFGDPCGLGLYMVEANREDEGRCSFHTPLFLDWIFFRPGHVLKGEVYRLI